MVNAFAAKYEMHMDDPFRISSPIPMNGLIYHDISRLPRSPVGGRNLPHHGSRQQQQDRSAAQQCVSCLIDQGIPLRHISQSPRDPDPLSKKRYLCDDKTNYAAARNDHRRLLK